MHIVALVQLDSVFPDLLGMQMSSPHLEWIEILHSQDYSLSRWGERSIRRFMRHCLTRTHLGNPSQEPG